MTITRFVLEAMAAAAAHDNGHEPPRITTIGFMAADLGGHSELSIPARARAVIDAISQHRALLG